MSLAAEMVREFFLAPGRRLKLGLSYKGTELSDGNYKRAVVSRWAVEQSSASASAEWGPFVGPVRFDAIVVYGEAGQVLRRLPAGEFSLPAGAAHSHVVSLGVED